VAPEKSKTTSEFNRWATRLRKIKLRQNVLDGADFVRDVLDTYAILNFLYRVLSALSPYNPSATVILRANDKEELRGDSTSHAWSVAGGLTNAPGGPLNWAMYYADYRFTGFQLKTWEDDLRYILRDVVRNVDRNAVQGTHPQYNIVKGAWNAQSPLSESDILYNVCQSTSCQ
jgi:hypothetical protein